MWAVLTDGRAALSAAEKDLAAAQVTYRQKTQRVFFETEAAWKASFAEYAGPVQAAEQAVINAAAALENNAHKVNRQVARTERSNVTPSEIAAANLVQIYVKEDCAERGLPQLSSDIANALVSNERAKLWLYQRYAKQRLANPTMVDKSQAQAAAEIQRQLYQIDRLFADTTLSRYADQAKAAINHVIKAESNAKARQKEIDRQKPAYSSDGRPLVRWPDR